MYKRSLQKKRQCGYALCAPGNACLVIFVNCRHSRDCRPAGKGVQDQDGACQADEEASLSSNMHQCQQPEAALC